MKANVYKLHKNVVTKFDQIDVSQWKKVVTFNLSSQINQFQPNLRNAAEFDPRIR